LLLLTPFSCFLDPFRICLASGLVILKIKKIKKKDAFFNVIDHSGSQKENAGNNKLD